MSKAKPPAEAPATVEEIKQAVVSLTTPQSVRLRRFARNRHFTLGRRGAGRNPEDLLSDALIALLEGRRKWFKSRCDIVKFLIGAMRSLASHIRDGKPADAFDELVSLTPSQDDDRDPIDQLPSGTAATPEDELIACEVDAQILARFENDEEALTVYDGFCEKMTPAEIRECGFTIQQFDAAAKRLRRGVKQVTSGGRP